MIFINRFFFWIMSEFVVEEQLFHARIRWCSEKKVSPGLFTEFFLKRKQTGWRSRNGIWQLFWGCVCVLNTWNNPTSAPDLEIIVIYWFKELIIPGLTCNPISHRHESDVENSPRTVPHRVQTETLHVHAFRVHLLEHFKYKVSLNPFPSSEL